MWLISSLWELLIINYLLMPDHYLDSFIKLFRNNIIIYWCKQNCHRHLPMFIYHCIFYVITELGKNLSLYHVISLFSFNIICITPMEHNVFMPGLSYDWLSQYFSFVISQVFTALDYSSIFICFWKCICCLLFYLQNCYIIHLLWCVF